MRATCFRGRPFQSTITAGVVKRNARRALSSSSMDHVRVVAIQHSPLNTAKSYLLLGERVVIVDTGPPDRGRRGEVVRRALSEVGRAPEDVSLIVATHAHPDHVGNVVALRTLTGAPVA